MAQLRDFPVAFRKLGVKGFVSELGRQISQDNIFTWGSALAYAWIFAIFPFLIFLLTLLPYMPLSENQNIQQQLAEVVYQLPKDAADSLWINIQDVMKQPRSGLLSIGLLLTLWAASGGMSTTIDALNRSYGVENTRPFWKHRLVAVALTLAAAVMVISVLLLLPIGDVILKWLHARGRLGTVLVWGLNAGRYVLALGILLCMIAMIFYFGPSIKSKWQTITPGAVFTVVVWLILGIALRLYVEKFANFNKTYGAVGGAIVLLFIFYVDSLVLLIGAEINGIIDEQALGVKRGTVDRAAALAKAAEQGPRKARDERGIRRRPIAAPPAPASRGKVGAWLSGLVFAAWWLRRKADKPVVLRQLS